MSSLQDLVPPVELCRLIPEGSFAQSALYWAELAGVGMDVFTRECGWCPAFDVCGKCKNTIPAPTLQEIISDLPHDACFGFEQHGDFWISLEYGPCFSERHPPTAALRFWLFSKEEDQAGENIRF